MYRTGLHFVSKCTDLNFVHAHICVEMYRSTFCVEMYISAFCGQMYRSRFWLNVRDDFTEIVVGWPSYKIDNFCYDSSKNMAVSGPRPLFPTSSLHISKAKSLKKNHLVWNYLLFYCKFVAMFLEGSFLKIAKIIKIHAELRLPWQLIGKTWKRKS